MEDGDEDGDICPLRTRMYSKEIIAWKKSTHPAKNTNLNPSKKSEERRRKLSRIFNLLSVAKSAKKQRRFRAVFQGLSLDGRT